MTQENYDVEIAIASDRDIRKLCAVREIIYVIERLVSHTAFSDMRARFQSTSKYSSKL